MIFTGPIGFNAVKAAESLDAEGIHCRVISMHTVKPIDEEAIIKAGEETDAVVTIEEHNINGGLGGAVAEVLLEAGAAPRKFKRIGMPDVFCTKVGSHNWLREQYGLSAEAIADTVKKLLGA